jgi:uncharacterized caspase-like protein
VITASARLPDPDRSYAVLVGTSTYESADLPDLPAVRNNLDDLAAVLTDPALGGLRADHCTILREPADAGAVSRALLRHAGRAYDTLLFYFAGHGLAGMRRRELYLALAGTDLDNPWFTALRYDDLRQLLLDSGRFQAINRVVILDCCFSGRAIPDTAAADPSGMVGIEGAYTLTATAANFVALAPLGARNTAFTSELLAVLRSGVPSGPELLTLNVIYQQVRRAMVARGLPRPEQINRDTVASLALARNLAFVAPTPPAVTAAAATSPPALPAPPGPRVMSARPGGRRGTTRRVVLAAATVALAGAATSGRVDSTPEPDLAAAVLTGHRSFVEAVAFDPTGTILATGGLDVGVRLWDVASRRQIGAPLEAYGEAVAFSPDGRTLAARATEGHLRLWNVTDPQHPRLLTGYADVTNAGANLVFSPDGTLLVSWGGYVVQLLDVRTMRQVGEPMTGHNDHVEWVAISPDGRMLATAGGETVGLWRLADRRRIGQPIRDSTTFFYSVAFSPDGRMLATGDVSDTLRLWDVATQRQVGQALTAHTGPVYSVAFSPDGRMLASGSHDRTVRLWDVARHRPIDPALTGHQDWVTRVAFSPAGGLLASGSNDYTVRLWDVTKYRG